MIQSMKNKKLHLGMHILFTVLWLTNLRDTDSYFSVYCLVAAGSLYAMVSDGDTAEKLSPGIQIGGLIFAAILALAPVLANYSMLERLRQPSQLSDSTNYMLSAVEYAVTYLTGIGIFYRIILYFSRRVLFPRETAGFRGGRPGLVFLISFGVILSIDLLYLFAVVYPGNLSHDTMAQIGQMHSGRFNNFTPYWHTRLLQALMSLGYWIFGNVNAAAAVVNVFQSMLMAAIFGYTVMTMYERKLPKIWLLIGFCMYAFLPYNISFSCSIWKDVIFGGAVLLTITAMYRIQNALGSHPVLDQILLGAGILLSSIARTNGWYVMLLSFLILVLVLRREIRRMVIPWVLVLLVSGIMNGPVLSSMGIKNIHYVETISVPIQQIARVVTEGGKISQEDLQLLDQVVDVEQIPEIYWDITADPIKDAIRGKNPDYLVQHKNQYIKLWLRVGKDNPGLYLKAWVDVTKGYWNGGYDYYTYAEYIADNEYGLEVQVSPNPIWKGMKAWFALTRETILFEPFLSIGLMAWLIQLAFYLNVICRRKEAVLHVPLLVIMLGLWIGAPVYSEFRYMYPLFAAYPLLFPSAVYGKPEKKTEEAPADCGEKICAETVK